jgi:hypothetical protein
MTSEYFDRQVFKWGLIIGTVGLVVFIISAYADVVAGGIVGAIVAALGLGSAGYQVAGLWFSNLVDRWALWYERRDASKQRRRSERKKSEQD